jgi:hypothetical protein
MQNHCNVINRKDDAMLDDLAPQHRLRAVLFARWLQPAAGAGAGVRRRGLAGDGGAGGAGLAAAALAEHPGDRREVSVAHLRENVAAALHIPADMLVVLDAIEGGGGHS